MLALGTATPSYALDRALETLIGAVIGILINLALVPPVIVTPARDSVTAKIEVAIESLSLNPRSRRHRDELAATQTLLERTGPIVTQTIGMTRAFCDHYDRSIADEPTVRAIAEQLRRAAHDVRLDVRRTDAAGRAEPETDEPAALTAPLTVHAPSGEHWVLIGSMLEDLRRIHEALREPVA